MAWSFRRRVKVIPGVHFNFSKSGISTSIGFKGASLTFGKSGTYLNTSIPGLGISNRQKLSSSKDFSSPAPIPEEFLYLNRLPENIFSADIQEITSQDMRGIKEAILAARTERKDLRKDIKKIKSSLTISKVKLGVGYLLIYGLVSSKTSKNIRDEIQLKKETLIGLKDCLENCYVKIEVEFDETIKEKYNRLTSAFNKLITSKKIWDVTSIHAQDQKTTRSAAANVVQNKDVKFDIQNLPEIKTVYPALHFQNANGADLFFYPTFIIMYESHERFAMIGYNEININYGESKYIEEGSIPSDSKIIDTTWQKVNKNGTPDKRFKDNKQIPIVRYGKIELRTNTGVNEAYTFSNYEFTEHFGSALTDYQSAINNLKNLE